MIDGTAPTGTLPEVSEDFGYGIDYVSTIGTVAGTSAVFSVFGALIYFAYFKF